MKGTTFTPNACPDCEQPTSLVHLGQQPPREVCGRFGCQWDGITLRSDEPIREEKSNGILIE